MTELVVIGRYAAEVARAIDPDAWVLDEGQGTPAIAARHAGREHDPAKLRDSAKEAAIVGLVGNPVAPLTPRYSLRDLAVELAVPVVVTVNAEPSLTGQARLYAEAMRGVGLPVAAVVIAGWPEPAGRVLLDERVMLYEVTEIPVLTLSPGETPDWPLDEWKATEPLAGAGAVRPQRVSLEPYREWQGESPGDPRSAPRPRIMEAMLEIVAAEGPVLATRAYAIYNKAAGGKKLTSVARAPLSNSIYHLAREGKVVLDEDDVVRLPDTAAVVVRELGPRELIEVPLDEIAELMRRLGPQDDLKRAVLNTYGLIRMTARAEQYLAAAEERL
ncbi:MAG TPA: AAA family ATPase [Solirubrobacteraceae bacterium]